MSKSTLLKLDSLAQERGNSRSVIITALLKCAMKDTNKFTQYNRRIQYQKRRDKNEWVQIHVYIHTREYEYFLDMRRLFKRSVSLMISIAIDVYSNEILKRDPDNNLFKHHIIIQEQIDGVIYWRIYWGFPRERTHLFPQIKLMH
ncbi:MAG: hypothetical protein JXA20_16165 [Spirochaetes bacterium]|nr:hypothetical protein [Spirochaetota bacterium]